MRLNAIPALKGFFDDRIVGKCGCLATTDTKCNQNPLEDTVSPKFVTPAGPHVKSKTRAWQLHHNDTR